MLRVFTIIVFLFILSLVIGLFKNQNIFTKILFLNSLGSMIAVMICFLGSASGKEYYFDTAIIYLIFSFVTVAAYLKYFLRPNDD